MLTHLTAPRRFSRSLAWTLGITILVGSAPVYAIPMTGTYEFTSVFTGTFTSDGSKLTVWTFEDPTGWPWNSSDDPNHVAVLANDSETFSLFNTFASPRGAPFVTFQYISGEQSRLNYSGFNTGNGGQEGIATFQAAAVPVPSTFLLTTAGFLALVGYHWRRQRVHRLYGM